MYESVYIVCGYATIFNLHLRKLVRRNIPGRLNFALTSSKICYQICTQAMEIIFLVLEKRLSTKTAHLLNN